jgi:hypothetical protein
MGVAIPVRLHGGPTLLRRGALLWLLLLVSGCGGTPFTFSAAGPYFYSSGGGGALDRLAIVATITNLAGDDLVVNPADFVARDGSGRIYPSNPAATVTDTRRVSVAPGLRGTLPLPAITLRTNDTLSGFVVFDVPHGAQPTELIWRQIDSDAVTPITAPR